MKKIVKKILLVSLALVMVLSLFGCSGGGGTTDKESTKKDSGTNGKMSDSEYLAYIGEWEKEGYTGVRLVFNDKGGVGKYTSTDGSYWTETTWRCYEDEGKLELVLITPSGDIEYVYDYQVFQEDTPVLEIIDLENGESTLYFKKGTQKVPEVPKDKPEALIGTWIDDGTNSVQIMYLASVGVDSGVGLYNPSNNTGHLSVYLSDWGATDQKLMLKEPNGAFSIYTYILKGNTLEVYKGDTLSNVFTKKDDATLN